MKNGHMRATAVDQPLLACIDAGGSRTRLHAARGEATVYRGRGGPANPTAVDAGTLRQSFAEAVAGCPEPDALLVAVAGAGSEKTQRSIRDLLCEFFPSSRIAVVPDYVGAFRSCPAGTDLCVIAGTGSVVVSQPRAGGRWRLSGGHGWLLGDHGSAVDLGRTLLSAYVDDPGSVPEAAADEVLRTYQVADWRGLIRRLQASASPAHDLALAAPILTGLADAGHDLAQSLVESAMDRLAATTARHIRTYIDAAEPIVGLVGGVWSGRSARDAFVRRLEIVSHGVAAVADDSIEPVDRLLRHVLSFTRGTVTR
jgi:N-acetylglucosamine kinase-like BadF-type ATPase